MKTEQPEMELVFCTECKREEIAFATVPCQICKQGALCVECQKAGRICSACDCAIDTIRGHESGVSGGKKVLVVGDEESVFGIFEGRVIAGLRKQIADAEAAKIETEQDRDRLRKVLRCAQTIADCLDKCNQGYTSELGEFDNELGTYDEAAHAANRGGATDEP